MGSSKLQLEKEILDFSEGLRVVGVRPEEKIALFAENSCRWLVADQGIQFLGIIANKDCLIESIIHSSVLPSLGCGMLIFSLATILF